MTIKEWPPKLYNEYNGIEETDNKDEKKKESTNLFKLLVKAPSTFWTVGVVQFFCWVAFLFMWTYTTGTVAEKAFKTPEIEKIVGLNDGNRLYTGKYMIVNDSSLIAENGEALLAGLEIGGKYMPCSTLVLNSKDTIVKNHHILFNNEGKPNAQFGKVLAHPSDVLNIDGEEIRPDGQVYPKDYLSQLHGGFRLTTAAIMVKDKKTGKMQLEDSETHLISDRNAASFESSKALNTASPQYNKAGDWVGILFAIQALGSVAWAMLLPKLGSRKFSYSLSLALGAIGFVLMGFLTNQYIMFAAFLLIGCAWAAMLAWPFTLLTNSLKGGNIGAYLGLFNCTICIPQIIGAIVGGWILSIFSSPDQVAPQWVMMIVAGVSLAIGACCVSLIKDKK